MPKRAKKPGPDDFNKKAAKAMVMRLPEQVNEEKLIQLFDSAAVDFEDISQQNEDTVVHFVGPGCLRLLPWLAMAVDSKSARSLHIIVSSRGVVMMWSHRELKRVFRIVREAVTNLRREMKYKPGKHSVAEKLR